MSKSSSEIQSLGSFVWSIAQNLRGDFKQSEYGKVVLPFVVLRRLDCILEATKDAVLDAEKYYCERRGKYRLQMSDLKTWQWEGHGALQISQWNNGYRHGD